MQIENKGRLVVTVRDVAVGGVFRRWSDGLVFEKTNEKIDEDIDLRYLCLELSTGQIHRIRSSTVAEVVPQTTLTLNWQNS